MKRYFIPLVRECLDGAKMADLKNYFDESYSAIIAYEARASMQQLNELLGRIKSNPHPVKSLQQKSRYWVDGVVISDKEYYRGEIQNMLEVERAKRRFASKCFTGLQKLYSLRHFTH